jgi:hypothetical protein
VDLVGRRGGQGGGTRWHGTAPYPRVRCYRAEDEQVALIIRTDWTVRRCAEEDEPNPLVDPEPEAEEPDPAEPEFDEPVDEEPVPDEPDVCDPPLALVLPLLRSLLDDALESRRPTISTS